MAHAKSVVDGYPLASGRIVPPERRPTRSAQCPAADAQWVGGYPCPSRAIILGLLAIVIGLAWAFYGLKLFTILLPIWAFFFGLLAGAQWGQDIFGQPASSRPSCRGALACRSGSCSRAISYFWYYAAIVILGGAVGYALGVGVFESFGFETGSILVIVGLIVGALFAIGTFLLGVPVLLVMILSAFSGAAAVVNGVLIFLGQIKLENLDTGSSAALLHNGLVGHDRLARPRRGGAVLPAA